MQVGAEVGAWRVIRYGGFALEAPGNDARPPLAGGSDRTRRAPPALPRQCGRAAHCPPALRFREGTAP